MSEVAIPSRAIFLNATQSDLRQVIQEDGTIWDISEVYGDGPYLTQFVNFNEEDDIVSSIIYKSGVVTFYKCGGFYESEWDMDWNDSITMEQFDKLWNDLLSPPQEIVDAYNTRYGLPETEDGAAIL